MITDVDPILKAAEPYSTIQLGPGLHTTYGCGTSERPDGVELKQGCRLIGDESGTTVIMCIRPMTEEAGDASVIRGQGENVVANLTVDGGVPITEAWPTATPYPRKRNLVFLKGDDNWIENVTGRRQYGIFANDRESFGLSCWGDSTITGCKILDVLGTYATAMQALNLEWCEVTFPRLPEGIKGNFRAAFNMGETNGGTVSNCQAYWAMAGVYTDWKDCRNLTVTDCLFHGVETGLYINAEERPGQTELDSRCNDNIKFIGNKVYLDPERPNLNGVLIDHRRSDDHKIETKQHCANDVLIEGNEFDFLPGEMKAKSKYALNVFTATPAAKRTDRLGVSGINYRNNVTHPALEFRWIGDTDSKISKLNLILE